MKKKALVACFVMLCCSSLSAHGWRQLTPEELAYQKEIESIGEKSIDDCWKYLASVNPAYTKAVEKKDFEAAKLEFNKMILTLKRIDRLKTKQEG